MKRYQIFSQQQKWSIVQRVDGSRDKKRDLAKLGIARSTYYDWKKNNCQKNTTRPPDTISVPLSNGDTCAITIEHLGRDDSDAGAARDSVSYETLQSDLNGAFPDSRKIGMDDNPATGCQNNLQFTNEWTPGSGILSVKSTKNAYNATNGLEYGYKLTASPNCALLSFTQQSCTLASWQSPTCNTPSIDANKKSLESVQPWQPNLYIPWLVESAQYQYSIVPNNAPTLTIKNTSPDQWYKENPSLDIDFRDDFALDDGFYQIDSSTGTWTPLFTNNSGKSYTTTFSIPSASWTNLSEGSHTIYFKATDDAGNCAGCDGSQPFTIKKDTVAPTSKITIVDAYNAAEGAYKNPGVRLNYPLTGQSSAYLNADNDGNTKKTWWMYVTDTDTGSGLNTCSISINGVAKPDRSCVAGWLTFTVGKDDPTTPLPEADCMLYGDDKCTIKVWAKDNVGNITSTKNVNDITKKEKDYLDGAVTQDANEFTFSVDWKKPTAQ